MKKENGMSLIALVVTMVVLIILTGASISMLLGDRSIFQSAQTAVTGEENAGLELALSEIIQEYTADSGYKARGSGIDSYLIKNNYIESDQILFERHNRIFYKVDLSEVLDGDIESGHGIEINEEEWRLKGEEVPEIEYMKDFYFIEFIPTNDASSTTKTARLVLLYIDKYGKEHDMYKFPDEYNVDDL